MPVSGEDWTASEIEVIIPAYFRMWEAEQLNLPYVKAQVNRDVQVATGRSRASVEFKMRNISAALAIEGGVPIRGYLPARNTQIALREAVADYWEQHPRLDELMAERAASELATSRADFAWQMVEAPSFDFMNTERLRRHRRPIRVDFAELEARQRVLGQRGEELVVSWERDRLISLGEHRLASKVEHTSGVRGDGLGFDVLSFEQDGRQRLIEVKTTRGPIATSFLASRNEVERSREDADIYHVFRLFNFDREEKKYYILDGALDATCHLTPTVMEARPKSAAAPA